MNAEPQDQWRLLDLQEKDTRLSQLSHRAATLPEAAALVGLDTRFARTRAREVLDGLSAGTI